MARSAGTVKPPEAADEQPLKSVGHSDYRSNRIQASVPASRFGEARVREMLGFAAQWRRSSLRLKYRRSEQKNSTDPAGYAKKAQSSHDLQR